MMGLPSIIATVCTYCLSLLKYFLPRGFNFIIDIKPFTSTYDTSDNI